MTIEDKILKDIEAFGVISSNKDDGIDKRKAIQKLKAFGLIHEQPKSNWRLTEKGYKAILIGFDNWVISNNKHTPFISADNISIITGDNNRVDQSRFDNLRNTEIKQTENPIAYENKQNAEISWIQKYWWQVIIPFSIGLILLILDKKWK